MNHSKQAMRVFEQSLPMTLMRCREAVMRQFMPVLRQHGLSQQQWRVIRALKEHGEMDLTQLTARCLLLKPSLSRIVSKLAKRELIERRPSTIDHRRSMVALNANGTRLYEKIAPLAEERYAHIAEALGHEQLDTLYALLFQLINVLEAESPLNWKNERTNGQQWQAVPKNHRQNYDDT